MIRLFLVLDNCDEFNKTQLYIMNENTLDISNINELNESEYIIKTIDILKNTDNYEQSKSEIFQNTTTSSYLTDLEHEQSNISTVKFSTDYSTNGSNYNINTGIITHFFESDIFNTEKQETYLLDNEDFFISPDKCLCGENFSYLLIKNKKCIKYCNIEQLLDKICKVDCVSINNFNSIKKNVESIIYKDNFTDNEEIVIVGNNVIYDIMTSKMEHKNKNISYIDFGECETKLKQQNDIDYLLIIKYDTKLDESSPTNIQYKVYDPTTKRELNLSICSDDKINIDIPLILVG